MNLLSVPLIRAASSNGAPVCLSLAGTFASLMRDVVESFPALRPHQRHAWHAFLAQVGALALIAGHRSDPPGDEESWAALLRGLTPDYPGDEPWSLTAPADKPALLQPPIPSGNLAELKTIAATPDSLDMLVTSKNHDLKAEVMATAAPDDWLFALVTLQTMEGFLGAGNYGASRMNGGFANRAAVSVAPVGRPGEHLRRDIARLVALRQGADTKGYAPANGVGLVWLRPWDGITSLRQTELDPYYVEICRRVRLVEAGGRLHARAGNSKVPRIVPVPGGLTGDPWAPVVRDKGEEKVFTADAGGFGYRRMVELMFPGGRFVPSALQELVDTDANTGQTILARALTRGQGKTEGYHERRVPISKTVRIKLSRRDTDDLAARARTRVDIAGEIQNRVLKAALLALFENGPERIDFRDDGANRRAEAFLARFDGAVDRDFFPKLWEEFEEGADWHAKRSAWVHGLLKIAATFVDEADQGASKALKRRYKARARADAVLYGAPRRNPKLQEFFEEVTA